MEQERSHDYQISPMYKQLIFFTIPIKRSQWKRIKFSPIYVKASVKNLSSNSTLAEREFLLKYGHHCICISICYCQVRYTCVTLRNL